MMRLYKGKEPPTVPAKATRRRPPLAAMLGIVAILLSVTALGQSRETLGEGDSIRIAVFQNPDLTTETRISERGTITFPLIGEVAIAGLTPAGAEARIARQLIPACRRANAIEPSRRRGARGAGPRCRARYLAADLSSFARLTT